MRQGLKQFILKVLIEIGKILCIKNQLITGLPVANLIFKMALARCCLLRNFSRRFYAFHLRTSLKTGKSLKPLQQLSVSYSNLYQSVLKTQQITHSLAKPQRFCSTLSSDDALDEISPISEGKTPENQRTLFVGNLNLQTSQSSLKDHFSRFGEIEEMRMGKNKRYTFVVFKNPEAIDDALKKEHCIDSNSLVVEKSFSTPRNKRISPDEKTLFVGNLDVQTSQSSLEDYFSRFGEIEEIRMAHKGPFAFVVFKESDAFKEALKVDHVIDSKSVVVLKKNLPTPGQRTAFVGNLNIQTSQSTLKDHFSKFGEIEEVRMSRKGPYAFVVFKDTKALNGAIREEHVIDSSSVNVEKSGLRPSNQRKIFISNIPSELNSDDILTYFSQFGAVHSVTIPWDYKANQRSHIGFVKFFSSDSALKSIEIREHKIQGSIIQSSAYKSKVFSMEWQDEVSTESQKEQLSNLYLSQTT